jgi:lysyl-tRNA synthetase class 2
MWKPTGSLQAFRARADLYEQIRFFFADRKVQEVETPLLGVAGVTDPHIHSLALADGAFLQTSPEYFMKRLLAAGSGDIFQICKAFRAEEQGDRHNREFTLLEWYRQGFDLWELMDEMADLVEQLLGCNHFEHLSYAAAFDRFLGIDPFTADVESLKFEAQQHINVEMPRASKDDWLNLLMSHLIEPHLGHYAPVFLYDYPPSQASLARISQDESGNEVAERFELYYRGMELANGYHELADAEQQRSRFLQDNLLRQEMGLKAMPMDEDLLQALANGLPDCSGVALGLDRVLMIRLGCSRIDEVLSFR